MSFIVVGLRVGGCGHCVLHRALDSLRHGRGKEHLLRVLADESYAQKPQLTLNVHPG